MIAAKKGGEHIEKRAPSMAAICISLESAEFESKRKLFLHHLNIMCYDCFSFISYIYQPLTLRMCYA